MSLLNIVKSVSSKEINNLEYDEFLFGKDETLKPTSLRIFGIKYAVNIYYLKIESPKLNLIVDQINIYLPMAYRKINNQELINKIILKMYTKIAENEIDNIMEKARHTFDYAPEDYSIKDIPGTLANCNKDMQTISINPYLMKYSKDVIEYVIFHEFCHLRFKNHTKSFYDMLKKYKPNYETFAKQLSNYKY